MPITPAAITSAVLYIRGPLQPHLLYVIRKFLFIFHNSIKQTNKRMSEFVILGLLIFKSIRGHPTFLQVPQHKSCLLTHITKPLSELS